MRSALLLLLATAALPQDQTTPVANATVSGTVRDAGTGKPLKDFNVSTDLNATWIGDMVFQSTQTKQIHSVTDENGRYRLTDLPPGPYRMEARGTDFGSNAERRVTVSGHDLDNIDFHIKANGSISGKVVDENKEPVPGLTVYLVSREYFWGILGYFLKSSGITNDRGQYTLQRVQAGRAYYVMVETLPRRMPAHSEVPLNPKLRRRAAFRTFYPNSPNKEGAAPIVVRPGEHRENVDIELRKAENYCVDGTLTGPMGAAAYQFGVEGQPTSGMSSTGGLYALPPGGRTSRDGKFRICDLPPGAYRFTAWQTGTGGQRQTLAEHAMVNFSIGDQDLTNFNLTLNAGPTLKGEVVLEGPAPLDPIQVKSGISLGPILRAGLQGENYSARVEVPGTFSFDGLVLSDYGVRASINSTAMYVKSIEYAGNDARYEPLHMGSAMEGATLRVTIARDGATLSATTTDKDGNPVGDIQVIILPKDIPSEPALQMMMIRGATDQMGRYQSHIIRPGKYYVVATEDSIDPTPESINRLWRARNRFQEVELAPNATASLSLKPVEIR